MRSLGERAGTFSINSSQSFSSFFYLGTSDGEDMSSCHREHGIWDVGRGTLLAPSMMGRSAGAQWSRFTLNEVFPPLGRMECKHGRVGGRNTPDEHDERGNDWNISLFIESTSPAHVFNAFLARARLNVRRYPIHTHFSSSTYHSAQ